MARNSVIVPEAKEAMKNFKMQAASEVGVNLKDGYNGIAEIYTSDYFVHMNTEGTAVWAKALKEYGFQQEKETP